jgi:hypothetical protein
MVWALLAFSRNGALLRALASSSSFLAGELDANPAALLAMRRPATAVDGQSKSVIVFMKCIINDAHPAYTAPRCLAVAWLSHPRWPVALALVPRAVEPCEEHAFITQFLADWNGVQVATRMRGRRRIEEDGVKRRSHARAAGILRTLYGD